MTLGKFIRGTLAGGTMYWYYQSGLLSNSDVAIKNYAILRKDAQDCYEANPSIVHIIETGESHLSSTVAPAVDVNAEYAVSNFKKEWLNFDFYWLGSGDGVIKPTWNKSVAWTCDFLSHAPEDFIYGVNVGWEKLNEYISESTTAVAKPK